MVHVSMKKSTDIDVDIKNCLMKAKGWFYGSLYTLKWCNCVITTLNDSLQVAGRKDKKMQALTWFDVKEHNNKGKMVTNEWSYLMEALPGSYSSCTSGSRGDPVTEL